MQNIDIRTSIQSNVDVYIFSAESFVFLLFQIIIIPVLHIAPGWQLVNLYEFNITRPLLSRTKKMKHDDTAAEPGQFCTFYANILRNTKLISFPFYSNLIWIEDRNDDSKLVEFPAFYPRLKERN